MQQQRQKTSAGAVWSLVLGILSFACLGPLTGIPAIICGHISRGSIVKSNGQLTGGGMALAGLILGYASTALLLLWLLFSVGLFGVFGDTTRQKMGGAVEELGGDTSGRDEALEEQSSDWLKDLDSDGSK